ncbi:MAG: site-specific integrase [bacterium]
MRRFILFQGKRHPRDLGEGRVGEFLTQLAVDRNLAASTQNQALNALVFLNLQERARTPAGGCPGRGTSMTAAALAGGAQRERGQGGPTALGGVVLAEAHWEQCWELLSTSRQPK